MAVEVRRAGAADVAAMVAIVGESPEAPQWSAGQMDGVVTAVPGDVAVLAVVAVVAEAVVGFAVARRLRVEGEPAEMESVAVARAWRRRGVGRALCAAVEAWSREEGAAVLLLEVRAGNAGARAMYERRGFAEVGRRRRYYVGPVEDAVVLRLAM